MKPQIVIESQQGRHNTDPQSHDRLIKGASYKDVSTICVVPTRGVIPAKVVQNWLGMMTPMNQKFIRVFIIGMEVGEAYDSAIKMIINHPDLSKWKYVLTLEEDNMPPADGLLKLLENINRYDAIGGLYWTKGEAGQPMIYGDPTSVPFNFIPQVPQSECLQECNGLGMGFTLFRLDMFKDPKLGDKIFETVQRVTPEGPKAYTQDLHFFERARMLGYKMACDTRVRVGHYEIERDIVW